MKARANARAFLVFVLSADTTPLYYHHPFAHDITARN